ncbi:MAG: deoxyguanosinetriphosphate triphosphohydrolase [Alphaproteobacteria bacterium]|nr:deoxyguanosinetriphosphate triphosphohydrolase [Alphaproteobacteria bacterium]
MTPTPLPTGYAPYATKPEDSRGRLYSEPQSATRTPFQRDRDRIIHAAAFRRLMHKTQVFVAHEGDHFRTRLTHSLEVAQIARSIARVLALNEDLAETLALAHDLGHTPFGHAGEEALNKLMEPYGGFDHNAQSLRIITRLERKYAEFDGLNLTWETLEGLVKHNGPLVSGATGQPIPAPIIEYTREHDLEIDTYAGPEAQVAALSDDIAYNNHDIDDGLRAGLFTVEDLAAVPLVGEIVARVQHAYPDIEQPRLIHETVRRLIDHMISDLLQETRIRLREAGPRSASEVRELGHPVVAFSAGMVENDQAQRAFLHERMYRHEKVRQMSSDAGRVVRELYEGLTVEPDLMPQEWRARAGNLGGSALARVVADYIAGMTDRFALEERARLFGSDLVKI